MRWFASAVLFFSALVLLAPAQPPTPGSPQALKTRHVILIMSDGLRWQEVFRGAEEGLLTKEGGLIDKPEPVKKEFWRDTPEARREALMPFLWSTVAKGGQIYGNLDRRSDAHVTNGRFFSYPGYNETFCGFADDRIDSNNKVLNQNVTVFEWLHGKPAFKGKVAAFGAWDVFPFIFNAQRAGFPVDGGDAPITQGVITPEIRLLNRLKAETPMRWNGAHFDSLVFHTAMEWFGANKPSVMFLGLGETDEWGHEGKYADYLRAAHRADAYIKELWETVQSIPEYKDSTTLIITCDHGRGDNSAGIRDWNSHGVKHPGSDQIWIAFLGPDTPPLGERHDIDPVTQSQIAATLAALLGEDYNAAQPKAAPPIRDALAAPRP